MISVVIGTYNRASMVVQAIEAALAQTLAPDEIIVSDDASTDGTWAALEAMAAREPRLRVFRQEKNTCAVPNWNFAVAQARGEYIALCSDDDRFLPDHLANSVAHLRTYPRVGLVHSSFVDSIEKSESQELVPRVLRSASPLTVDRKHLLPYLLRYYDWPFHPSTIVMRRKVWNRVGPFDEAYQLTDTDWFVRAAEIFAVTMLPRHGVINRRHAGNWSNRMGSSQMQREIFQIVDGSIRRREWGPLQQFMWRFLWRTNVRLRLLLTLRARLNTGHTQAAVAAWQAMCQGTGRSIPRFIQRAGETAIRGYSLRRNLQPNESVSPL